MIKISLSTDQHQDSKTTGELISNDDNPNKNLMLNQNEFIIIEEKHKKWALFADRIRIGLSDGTELLQIKEYILFYWRETLSAQFSREELIFLPFLNHTAYASQLRKEHEDIKELILSLHQDSDTAMFGILSDFIRNLIKFEKLFLISFLLKNLTDDQKIELIQKLKIHSSSEKPSKYDFWNCSKARRRRLLWSKRAA